MAQHFQTKILCVLLLACTLCLAVAEVQAKKSKQTKQQSQQTQQALTAAEASAKAKTRHGGTVLKVTPKGQGFRVKLLTDSGRVMTVTIKD